MAQQLLYDTLPPGEISQDLRPVVEQLGIVDNCQQLASQGYTVLHDVEEPGFAQKLRTAILDHAGPHGGANMLLSRDPVYARAVLNPKLLALAEFSVGRGFLISQVAASVRKQGAPTIGLHADHNWLPAPFPAHNMLMTACWACDPFTKAGGATLVIPGTQELRRHPNAEEVEAEQGAIAIECPAGSVAVWDGNVWHSNWPREEPGERVVCHITYSRLMMRQVEDYRDHEEALIAAHGPRMAGLLGREDGLFKPRGFDYSKLAQTFNNAKR